MSKIHFIGGEKGGIDKSVLARLLAQYPIDRALPFIAFDTDRSHGALQRFVRALSKKASVPDYPGGDGVQVRWAVPNLRHVGLADGPCLDLHALHAGSVAPIYLTVQARPDRLRAHVLSLTRSLVTERTRVA
jgi:hypothetical protein